MFLQITLTHYWLKIIWIAENSIKKKPNDVLAISILLIKYGKWAMVLPQINKGTNIDIQALIKPLK